MNDSREPARKWRVRDRDAGKSQTYGSESRAYDAVNAIAAEGHSAMVTHWEDGRWRLFEMVKPDVTQG